IDRSGSAADQIERVHGACSVDGGGRAPRPAPRPGALRDAGSGALPSAAPDRKRAPIDAQSPDSGAGLRCGRRQGRPDAAPRRARTALWATRPCNCTAMHSQPLACLRSAPPIGRAPCTACCNGHAMPEAKGVFLPLPLEHDTDCYSH
ncbi:unnamed protein product, partial [Ixodes pacificus]